MTDWPSAHGLGDRLTQATGAEIQVEDFGASYFIEARLGDTYVVIEARPQDHSYGVTRNPALFAGSDLVFTDPNEAVDAAIRLLAADSQPAPDTPSVLTAEEIQHRFPLAASHADPAQLRAWAVRPALNIDAA